MDDGYKELFKILTEKDDGCKPSDLSELLECPTDEEILKATREFCDEQGDVPTAFAFQVGARWVREYKKRAV